jgi:hypothetical protein
MTKLNNLVELLSFEFQFFQEDWNQQKASYGVIASEMRVNSTMRKKNRKLDWITQLPQLMRGN